MSRAGRIGLFAVASLSILLSVLPAATFIQVVGAEEGEKGVEVMDIRQFLEPDDYTYDPQGKRDPFRSLISARNWELGAKIGLEKFDLTEVKLTGVIVTRRGPIAIVEGPNRKSYFVRMNDAMGLNQGKVVDISADGVIVEERVISDFGEATTRNIVLPLHEKGG